MKNLRNPTARYIDIYSAMLKNKRWWWDTSSFPFAAISTLGSDENAETIATNIHAIADQLKDLAGWFGELNESIRFVIAAMIFQNNDSAEPYMAELRRVRKLFREHRIRNGGYYEVVAITILRYGSTQQKKIRDLSEVDIERFQFIHKEMAKHQWWITSVDDYPACAVLCSQPESPIQMCGEIESIYQQLVAAGFWKGNPLQSAANMLFLAKEHPAAIAAKFHEISEVLRLRRIRVWQTEYDEIAILSLIDQPSDTIVNQVENVQAELLTHKPRPSKQQAFDLACTLCFFESTGKQPSSHVTSAKAMIDLSSAIAAQAAAVAAISAMTAATTATAAASG